MLQKEQVEHRDIFNASSSSMETANKTRFYVSRQMLALTNREMVDYIPVIIKM